MPKTENRIYSLKFCVFFIFIFNLWFLFFSFLNFGFLELGICQEESIKEPVIVNADKVEFFSKEKKAVAECNVVITQEDVKLTCDKAIVYSETQDAIAEGNVHFYYEKGILKANKLIYNFQTKKGKLLDFDVESNPYYGKSEFGEKVSENEIKMKHGYFTTCDLAKPHYRLRSRRLTIFPGDKVEARDIIFLVGGLPLMYMPSYTHPIDDRRPRVTVLPGKDKDWGVYLLTAWRYYFNENAKGRLHLDYREKKDFAWGVDYKYKIEDLGDGLLRTYYMHERNIQSEHLWKVPRDTEERERFRVQLRHKWDISPQDKAILEYNKIKDTDFLEDYFYRESEKMGDNNSFVLYTHTLPEYTFSFLTRKRTNRIFSEVERKPELKIETPDINIWDSLVTDEKEDSEGDLFEPRLINLYFQNQTSLANLTNKGASPSELRDHVKRLDTYNKLSLQKKVAFIEARPYVATRQTYYNKDKFSEKDLWRSVFYTGIDLSTKFYRIFELSSDFLGIEINRIRHIITPTVSYGYTHEPTIPWSKLQSFDGIDAITRSNSATVELQNKLQTKWDNNTVDFVNFRIYSDYTFKPKGGTGSSFSNINFDLEVIPYRWLQIDADASYDHNNDYFSSANIDLTVDLKEKFSASIGHRYQRKRTKQLTASFRYRISPKWKFSVYERYQFSGKGLREQEYSIERDLHCWTMAINYNVSRVGGEEIWIVFKIKAFPEAEFEFNKSYHSPKLGSQNLWMLSD